MRKSSKPDRPTKKFAIAEKFTHTVLRLPVAYLELNFIELAWSAMKRMWPNTTKIYLVRG